MKHLALGARLRRSSLRPFRLRGAKRCPEPNYAEIIGGMRGRGIFLFSFTRSGTTLFCELLASHPSIRSFGEVLNEQSPHSLFRDFPWRAQWRAPRPSRIEQEFYAFLARKVYGAGGDLLYST